MDDSDRNIMQSLAHEADEPCYYCEEPVSMVPLNPPGTFGWEFTQDDDGEVPCHEQCHLDAYDAHLERKGEAQAEGRWIR